MSNPCESSNSGSVRLLITTLYIKPLPAGELKHYEIVSYFSAFGDVKSVRIHSETEHSYGFVNSARICNETKHSYGFVKFTLPESATKALRVDSHLIAGRRVDVAVASDRHQDMPTLLSLNDDCIHEILSMKCLSAIDLCSVAETCRRLKEIASRVFKREYKECDLRALSDYESEPAKRILVNFGSEISELQMRGNKTFGRKWSRKLLPSIAEYCSAKSLHLRYFEVPHNITDKLRQLFKNLQRLTLSHCSSEGGTSTELFAVCESLIRLSIRNSEKVAPFIFDKTFPKLQQLAVGNGIYRNSLESFISRHMNLKSLGIVCFPELSVLQVIASCTRLEKLYCRISSHAPLDLANLGLLRELGIHCGSQKVMTTALGLDNLKLLEALTIDVAVIDSDFVQTLSQLKQLHALKLSWCHGLHNFNQMEEMDQLNTLVINGRLTEGLDNIRLVQRLSKLNLLSVQMQMDLETYLEIVDVVRQRADPTKLTLKLARVTFDYDFALNAHLVETIIVSVFPNRVL